MERIYYQEITKRINEPRKFIQIIEGPRQVGKSTLIKQVLQSIDTPWLHFAADNIPATRGEWIAEKWQVARAKLQTEHLDSLLLVFDEIQRLTRWSDWIKQEWDADTFHDRNIKVVLLGSSRVRLEKGLSESLKGRFEVIQMPNWSFPEMQQAFGMSLDEYIYYGGYPGAASLTTDPDRWRNYIRSSIVDATINNDILVDSPISKPALLRRTFELSAAYSGQILSYTKLIGQLQDAGNTTTISGYMQLLNQCGMVCALQKYTIDQARRRASIPKYQVYNNALLTLYSDYDFTSIRLHPQLWGRLVESAIGAHIVNCAYAGHFQVYYWRDGSDEVDFVLVRNGRVVAIEVKSNDTASTSGLDRFRAQFHPHRSLVVGPAGYPIADFLSSSLLDLFE